jgi:hypothetical protein
MNETSDNKPLVAGMAKAKVMLDCGADTLYDLIKAGELESYLEGKFRKITTASIERHIENRLAAGGKWDMRKVRKLRRSQSAASVEDGAA